MTLATIVTLADAPGTYDYETLIEQDSVILLKEIFVTCCIGFYSDFSLYFDSAYTSKPERSFDLLILSAAIHKHMEFFHCFC